MDKEKIKYSIGLDIGTSSVGWAVVGNNFKLLKKGNKNMWGSRLFETAETAANRRKNRSTRRRYNKRRERIRAYGKYGIKCRSYVFYSFVTNYFFR